MLPQTTPHTNSKLSPTKNNSSIIKGNYSNYRLKHYNYIIGANNIHRAIGKYQNTCHKTGDIRTPCDKWFIDQFTHVCCSFKRANTCWTTPNVFVFKKLWNVAPKSFIIMFLKLIMIQLKTMLWCSFHLQYPAFYYLDKTNLYYIHYY